MRLAVLVALFAMCGTGVYAQQEIFRYTGSVQAYKIPNDVTHVYVDMKGAMGGAATSSRGGYGGRVQGMLTVKPGSVLHIYVGGCGPKSTNTGVNGGYNGGGAGSEDGGGGGGATDIRCGGTNLSERVMVAGGGGGACGPTHVVAANYDRGGDGGGLNGETGYANGQNTGTATVVPGAGGGNTLPENKNIRNGGLGKGGNGFAFYVGGGGGGGGYFGGEGGDECGGGGGSSFTDPLLVRYVIHTPGYNKSEHGEVIIKPLRGHIELLQAAKDSAAAK